MNCKFKSFLSVLCGLFAVLFLFNSCETDRPETLESQQEFVHPAIKARHVRIQELLAQPKLAVKLNKLAVAGLGKSTNLAGIQLDTTGIRSIETDNYVSYTFKIVQDSIEKQTVLKNYILTIVNDTTEIQHLVAYNVLSPGVYDMDNIQATRVYGDDLRVQFSKCGNSFDWYSFEVCTAVYCGGSLNGVPLNHGPGEPCLNGEQIGRWECVTEWLPVMISDGGCNGGGGTGGDPGIGDNNPPGLGNGTAGGSGGGGGANTNPDPEPNDDDMISIGFVPNDGLIPIEPNAEDCASLGDFMTSNDIGRGSTSNESYIYNDLRIHAINNNFEKGQLITESTTNNISQRNYTELTGNASASGIYVNPNFPSDGSVIGLIHTHWEKLGSGSTLSSMFSMQDFLTFCTMVARRHRSGKDINALTFILVSHTGDVYALKPSSPEKMIDFYLNFQRANINEDMRITSKNKFDKTVARQFSQSEKERAFLSLVAESEVKMFNIILILIIGSRL